MEQSFYNINYATQPPPQFSQTPLQSMQSLPPPPILQSPPKPSPSSSQPRIVDKTIIFVKNFPIDFKKIEIKELLTKFGAINVKCKGKHSAFAKFANELEAKEILHFLHQKQINNYLLIAEYGKIIDFNNTSGGADNDNDIDNNNHQINNSNNNNNNDNTLPTLKLNNFVKLLNSTNMNLNFEQPPPPHLKYLYPKVNRNIIDSISIALETYPKFYVQVLHLMNRFNLEPPFIYGAQQLDYPKTLKSIGTQTEAQTLDATIINDCTLLEKTRKITDLASDESELESSVHTSSAIESDEEDNITIVDDLKKLHNRKRRRRQQHQQQQQQQLNKKHNLKRFRSIFDSEKNRQNNNNNNNNNNHSNIRITSNNNNNNIKNKIKSIDAAFVDKPMSINKTITIKTPTQLQQTDAVTDTEIVKSIKSNQLNDEIKTNSSELEQINNNKIHILSDKELYENRLPNNQLLSNPLFLNYKIGERSNKLYIKNLAKTVTENDLKSIYYRYLRKPPNNIKDVDAAAVATVEAASDTEIHIRLMKTGRMKGQAFITFNQPYLDDDNYKIVEKAISDTNGFILKDKIMIVNYGKKGS